MTSSTDKERFRSGVDKYAAYLETAEGRLRVDLAFANLKDFLSSGTPSPCALDIGGGTGVLALRLARFGFHVALLDSSSEMLSLAERNAKEHGVAEKIALHQGDASQVADFFQNSSFDLILCHNILEFVDDPLAVLQSSARSLRDRTSMLSVLVRNQAGEVLKAALKQGDLAAADRNLTSEWGDESLYGGAVRLFPADNLRATMSAASLAVIAERGVRVIADYLRQEISDEDTYAQVFELERKLGMRKEFVPIARYTHCLARRASSVVRDDA
jgi:S-adenosylmethionine-dependent methyltransferase